MLTSSLGQNSADNGESITLSYGRAIGRGNFGTVVEAKMPVTGEIVAVKRVRQDVRIKVILKHGSVTMPYSHAERGLPHNLNCAEP